MPHKYKYTIEFELTLIKKKKIKLLLSIDNFIIVCKQFESTNTLYTRFKFFYRKNLIY